MKAEMKRILSSLFLVLCLLLSCAFLVNSHLKNNISSIDESLTEQNGNSILIDGDSNVNVSEVEGKVSMTVSADLVGTLDVTITNSSDVDIEMGRDFSLRELIDETWKDVPLSLYHYDDLIVISPAGYHTFHYDIGSAVALESNTTYQISKVISVGQKDYSVFECFEID